MTPDARLRCRPKTRSVAFPCALSTGPYPVTSTCTTVGDTRLTSAAIESLNRRGDVIEVPRRERNRGGADPAVHLLRAARADNRAGDTWPRKRPCNGNRGRRRVVPFRDRNERVAQKQIPAQARLLELGRAA